MNLNRTLKQNHTVKNNAIKKQEKTHFLFTGYWKEKKLATRIYSKGLTAKHCPCNNFMFM